MTTRAKAFPSHVGSRMGLPDIGVSMKCRRPDALEFTRAVSMLIFLGMVPNLWRKRVDTRGQTGRVLLSRQSWNRLCWSVSHVSLHLSSTIKTCPWRHPLCFVPAIWMKVLSHNALSPVSIVCLFVCLFVSCEWSIHDHSTVTFNLWRPIFGWVYRSLGGIMPPRLFTVELKRKRKNNGSYWNPLNS